MNPFEAGTRKIIPAVLIYAKCGTDVLMVHRVAPGEKGQKDYHRGKWNGLGGKHELDESPLECAKRELCEESGLDLPLSAFKSLGVLQFPNFKTHKSDDWWVTVFVAQVDQSFKDKLAPCPEGKLYWIPAQDLLDLNLWAGDRIFIPNVISEKPFMGTLWYEGQEVKKTWFTQLA